MLGATKTAVISVVACQALLFAVPACLLGFLLSEVTIAFLLEALASTASLRIERGLDTVAVLEACALGFFMPLVASLVPSMRAVSPSIQHALDTSRARVQAVVVTINRADAEVHAFLSSFVFQNLLCLFYIGSTCKFDVERWTSGNFRFQHLLSLPPRHAIRHNILPKPQS